MHDDQTRRPLTAPTEWKTLEPLLDAALELRRERRAAFLAHACGDDATKLRKIELLLAECEQPDTILDRCAVEQFPSLLDDAPPLELPPVIGERFRVGREIGAGGMAVVFLAHDLKHQRDVAVKVMRPTLARVGAGQFLAEIQLTAALRHPHIVPLYDSGEVAGHVFFVMPYIDGESLRARLDRMGPLTPDEAVAIGRDVAAALDYVHARGVVHRDVKPSNLLIADGQAMLADFGIARPTRAGSASGDSFIEPGFRVGTPAYMSPEQASGRRELDRGSDIYSLGCVLYEMLAGRPPAAATMRQALAAHAIDPVTPLASIRPPVPPKLAQCVARAIALDPTARFATARELADALVDALAASSREAAAREPALGSGRSFGWIRRAMGGRRLAIGVLTTAAALGAITIAPSLGVRRADSGAAMPSARRPADTPAAVVTGTRRDTSSSRSSTTPR